MIIIIRENVLPIVLFKLHIGIRTKMNQKKKRIPHRYSYGSGNSRKKFFQFFYFSLFFSFFYPLQQQLHTLCATGSLSIYTYGYNSYTIDDVK